MTDRPPVTLPALVGTEPLGFLAALGVLQLLDSPGIGLSWDEASRTARLHGPFAGVDEVAEALADIVRMCPKDQLVPGLDQDLLPGRSSTSGPDPARIDLDGYRALLATDPGPDRAAWISTLWTDLSDDANGRCARTPFGAPEGQQTYRSMFANPAAHVAEDPTLWMLDALTAWTRVPGCTGEALDSRALREAAELPGVTQVYGTPGATFLAICSLRLFPLSGNGVLSGGDDKLRHRTERLAVGWYRTPRGVRPARSVFAWPLWHQPLGLPGVRSLVDHPEVASVVERALRPAQDDRTPRAKRRWQREPTVTPLGVWAVPMASRRRRAGGKSEGYLTFERIVRPS